MKNRVARFVNAVSSYKISTATKVIIAVSVLVIAFLISLISAISIHYRREKFILSFPHARIENKMVLRPRYSAKRHTKIEQIKELVLQLGLGPNEELRDKSFAFLPLGTTAKSVFIDEDKVLIELYKDFILQGSTVSYDTSRSLEFLKYNLTQNFNWIRELIVTVDGMILYSWTDVQQEKQADSEVADELAESRKER